MAARWRRLFASLNVLTVLLLLGVLFIMVNFIASRRYARWDFTKQKITALSDQTLQTLQSLQEPVSVVMFYQPGHRLYELITDLLDEYARVSPQIKVERVDPVQDVARARQLVQEFQIDPNNPDALNLVIFQAAAKHKYLSDTDLAEYDYATMAGGSEPRVKTFKGEGAFTSAIIGVTQASSSLLWLTSGHGEKPAESLEPQGLADVKKACEQQNMSVETVTLAQAPSIPPEVKLIVVPGPTRRFTETELTLLQTYLEQGGRLLALIDPLDETGLEGLLERWGVRLGMDIVVDPARQVPFVSAANLLVTTYTRHPIVEKMKMLVTLFPLARSIRPVEPLPEGLTVTPLALTSEEGWGETETSVNTFQYAEGKDLKGPVSIAVAVERASAEGTSRARARLVVIGDSDFIVNGQLGNAGNRDLLLGAIHWLIDQEQLIGIGPKPLESLKLNLTGGQLAALTWFSFLALPLTFGALGAAMWLIRRK